MTVIFVMGLREMSCMINVCSFLFRLRGWRLRKKKIRCLDEVTERGKRWITPISSLIENSWMYVYNSLPGFFIELHVPSVLPGMYAQLNSVTH